MSLLLLSLHYTGSFYNNSITKLWLVPILPERNLQFLTQNELVPELGKNFDSEFRYLFSNGNLKKLSIFTLLSLSFSVPFNTIRLNISLAKLVICPFKPINQSM